MSLAANEAGLYRSPWLSTPGNKGTEVGGSQKVVEVVLQDTVQVEPGLLRGRVTEVRANQPGIKLNTQTYVITGRDAAAQELAANLKPGDSVEVAYTLQGAPTWPWLPTTSELKAAASGGVVLVKNGVYGDSEVFTDPARHPRTAAAVSTDRSKLYLLIVDGRSKASVGMTYRELAEFFLHMGVFEAVNLDGGGSSTLSVKLPAFGSITAINTPSDGSERYVADGIGVFYHPNGK
jgi:hypothetical protein